MIDLIWDDNADWTHVQENDRIAVDGDSFSLSETIPDSVVLQYYATSWGEGSVKWVDDAGNSDMSIVGDMEESTLSDGAESISGLGDFDYGLFELPSELEGSNLESFSLEFAMQTTEEDVFPLLVGISNGVGRQLFYITLNTNVDGELDNGNIILHFGDDDNNYIDCSPTNNPSLTDGNRHDISIVVNDSTQSDIDFIIDGTSVSVSFSDGNSPSNFTTWESSCAFWTGHNLFGGSAVEYDPMLTGEIGAIRWHDTAISEQTISDYP